MRIVSLVPSLTETLFSLGVDDGEVVGRTAWCIHPHDRLSGVPILGGTKTPNLARIVEMSPDLVVLEREENRREAFDALESAGIATFVAHVTRVRDVPPMLESLGKAVGRSAEGLRLGEEVREVMDATVRAGAPLRAVPLIWHDPLMAVAADRYSGDLLREAGFEIPDGLGSGYPEVTPDGLGKLGVRWLLLSSEPHDFTAAEGDALADAVAGLGHSRPTPVKVDGEALTWFGSRTAAGLRYWRDLRHGLG